MVIATLFEAAKYINQAADGSIKLSADDIARLRHLFDIFFVDILGVRIDDEGSSQSTRAYEQAVDLLLDIRSNAKANRDWATSDLIRDKLAAIGFDIKDTKTGTEWKIKD